MDIFEIIMLVYIVWSLYAGWQIMSGRLQIAWCEQSGIPNKILKLGLSFCIGLVVGAFYAVYLIGKLVFMFAK